MGRIITLLLLLCLSVNAQRRNASDNELSIDGVWYTISDEMANDPHTFAYEFMKEARRRGLDYFRETGTIDFDVPSARNANPRTGDWTAYAINSCSPGFEIVIKSEFWNSIDFDLKRRVIYHEFGHAVMNLEHVCNNFERFPSPIDQGGFLFEGAFFHDIMSAAEECPDPLVENTVYGARSISWPSALNRLFNPNYQVFLDYAGCPGNSNPSARKGIHIIYD